MIEEYLRKLKLFEPGENPALKNPPKPSTPNKAASAANTPVKNASTSQAAMAAMKGTVNKQEVPEEDIKLDDLLNELNELTGLSEVKKDIKSLINLLKVKKLREERGIPESGIAPETAAFLRRLMCYTAADEDFQGRPAHVSMGAKTSTAQTGRCDVDGTEYCHGWVTAFFPAEQPKYAVTVLAEDGGYGNQAASPILRQIAGAIMQVE